MCQMVTASTSLAREMETILLHWRPLRDCQLPGPTLLSRLRLEVVVPEAGTRGRLGSAGSGD